MGGDREQKSQEGDDRGCGGAGVEARRGDSERGRLRRVGFAK